ncbi:hypothetical protein [Lonepinella koalarum]|uniref:Uncharacterized protein n=1 Tax=Lonepinella koalarum TaxID=53417 RepID=A0A4R1L1D2_9PAST|nr:hypothetical protein [Lonepinella koalarum]TCK70049.1 hypothetical protein EV692_1272 [Lonepinella koalarum]
MELVNETKLNQTARKDTFYTAEELDLIYKMRNGLEETVTHEEVMKNLKRVLKLDEN